MKIIFDKRTFIHLIIFLCSFSLILSMNFRPEPPPSEYEEEQKRRIDNLNTLRMKFRAIENENNELKLKKEIYMIYLYLLISINILLGLIIVGFIVYKICVCFEYKNRGVGEIEPMQINNTLNNSNQECAVKLDKSNEIVNDNYLTNCSSEAPTVGEYYKNKH